MNYMKHSVNAADYFILIILVAQPQALSTLGAGPHLVLSESPHKYRIFISWWLKIVSLCEVHSSSTEPRTLTYTVYVANYLTDVGSKCRGNDGKTQTAKTMCQGSAYSVLM